MASLRGVLFRDADFAAFYYPDNGKDSVPPSLLATALLLQSHDKVSDAEAKARADFDIRWKVALGIEVEDRPFAKSTLQVFRAKLVLLPGRSLETHRGIRLPASAARRHVGLQDGIAAVIAQGLELPGAAPRSFPAPRTPAGQRIPCKCPPELVEGFDPLEGQCLGRMASGDFRYLRTVFRAMPSSPAIPRIERPAPFIS